MVTGADIGWGAYNAYEGPFFRGKIRYSMPAQPDFMDKCLTVLTATEGGTYDAINMYDRCVVSVGLIQWCEAGQYSVSRLLGRCAELDSFMMDQNIVKFPTGTSFKKNQQGLWRFSYKGIEVSTIELQRQLFFGDAQTGQKGTWTPETKRHAKEVAAWFANFWEYPLFRTVQAEYTKQRLPGFLMPESKQLLFQGMGANQQFGWEGALRAAYYSFAGNLPAVANKSLQKAVQGPLWASADAADKFRLALQALTFASGITIYPARYDAIAPVLHRIFGVVIPLNAMELKDWADAPPIEMQVELTDAEKQMARRMIDLSNDVMMGRNIGLDALDGIDRGEA